MTPMQRLAALPMWVWLVLALTPFVALLVIGKVPLRYNLRNLTVRWRTTVMTAMSFTIVIGLLVMMYAFVNGMAALTEGSGRPGNVLVLADGATDELFSSLTYSDATNIEREQAKTDADGRPLPAPLGVARVDRGGKPIALCSLETYAIVNQPMPVTPGQPPRRRFVQVRGVVDPDVSGRVHGLSLLPGGAWFSSAGVQGIVGKEVGGLPFLPVGPVSLFPGATVPFFPLALPRIDYQANYIQAVMGESAARELGRDAKKPMLEVGDVFELGDRQWLLVGLMKSAGSTFDSEIWAKQAIVGEQFRKESYTSIVLRTADGTDAAAKTLAAHLTKNFRPAVQALPEKEYYAKLTSTNEQFLWAIRFVAFVMAVGGISGIMNTMFAAISQRIKDIGVLRILGYARWQILVSFLLESVVIALLGGMVGCLIGTIADGWTATSILSGGQGGGKTVVLKLIVDANIIATGMLLALAMGVLGGVVPSLSAMRLRPLDAVR